MKETENKSWIKWKKRNEYINKEKKQWIIVE